MSALEKTLSSAPGRAIARKAGLKDPPRLRRGRTWPSGAIVLGTIGAGTVVSETLRLLGRAVDQPVVDAGNDAPGYGSKIGALVVDATDVTTLEQLEELRALLRPAVRGVERSGRIVIVAREDHDGWEAAATARALDGINRTVSKELRGGATSTLLWTTDGTTPSDLVTTLGFVLQGRSAFVAGQPWHIGHASAEVTELATTPLTGKTVIVTGAARGIGAEIARTVARDGAFVIAVDVPAGGESLAAVANEVGGVAIQLDITRQDAGTVLAQHVAKLGKGLHGIVHNAGITRDKMLVNTDAARWQSVIDVNLAAQMRINEVLLDGDTDGGLDNGGRVIGVASTSGLAGNKGQANYAASKAGVAGLITTMAPDLAGRDITANAVAPGFIETEMTGKIPYVQREIFRRSNALSQGGRPVDVAETIAYLLDPGSQAVTGQVIRVCGHNLVGA